MNSNYKKQQELNKSLTNQINISYENKLLTATTYDSSANVNIESQVDPRVINKIRDLDPLSNTQVSNLSMIDAPPLSSSLDNSQNQFSIYRTLPKNTNPLRNKSGLYFRDILNEPEKSINISQSIRTNGSRFNA